MYLKWVEEVESHLRWLETIVLTLVQNWSSYLIVWDENCPYFQVFVNNFVCLRFSKSIFHRRNYFWVLRLDMFGERKLCVIWMNIKSEDITCWNNWNKLFWSALAFSSWRLFFLRGFLVNRHQSKVWTPNWKWYYSQQMKAWNT